MYAEKDVSRTDRVHKFFQGENNPNIGVLYDILMTHCMYNFDLGKSRVAFHNVMYLTICY